MALTVARQGGQIFTSASTFPWPQARLAPEIFQLEFRMLGSLVEAVDVMRHPSFIPSRNARPVIC